MWAMIQKLRKHILGGLEHDLPITAHLACHHQTLRLRAALRKAALDQ
jgi:hypothetical protein